MPPAELLDAVRHLRRRIHRRPELGNKEFETTAAVSEALERYGVPHEVRSEGTGVIAEFGSDTGPVVGYRADLDALPITEALGIPFASEVPGVMHACGHDAHTAIAVGVAATLAAEDLPGRVRVIFQPAEEVFPGGAEALVDEGRADGLSAIMALHADPALPAGHVGIKAGPITSSSDRFTVVITGPGGHTARPHETPDTLLAAGKLLSELEALFSRRVDARIPRAVVFGSVHGGEASNVIPASVRLSGTVRIADRAAWRTMDATFTDLVHQIVAPLGVGVSVEYEPGIAPVVNHEVVVLMIEDASQVVVGNEHLHSTYTSMGAEDFSHFTQAVPGALLRLGCSDGGPFTPLHSAAFRFDETALGVGVDVGAESLRRLLAQANSNP
jgi:amidohydrolase